MKISQSDLVLVPGYKGASEGHWQSRWEAKFGSARSIRQQDWLKPDPGEWEKALIEQIGEPRGPLVLACHSIGCHVAINALTKMTEGQLAHLRGLFLVAPPDVENESLRPKQLLAFGPYRRDPLPVPSVVIASQTDPFCSMEVAKQMAASWGSLFMNGGENGHLNEESGHGPWPEGLLVFGEFMKRLDAA